MDMRKMGVLCLIHAFEKRLILSCIDSNIPVHVLGCFGDAWSSFCGCVMS